MTKITKVKHCDFTIIDNNFLRDERLSFKAKGLFMYMWSQSNDWNFYVNELSSHAKDGRNAVMTGLEELENYGYLKRKRVRNAQGQLKETEYVLSETPTLEKPKSENPTLGKPTLENQTLTSTNNNKNKQNNNSSTARDSLDNSTKDIESKQNAFELYQITAGILTPTQYPIMSEYIRKLSDDVVKFAINNMTNQTTTPNFNYLNTILMKYESLGIDTVEKAKELEKKRQSSFGRTKAKQKRKSRRKNTLPF